MSLASRLVKTPLSTSELSRAGPEKCTAPTRSKVRPGAKRQTIPRFTSVPTYEASPLQPAPRGLAGELAVCVAQVIAATVAPVPPAKAVVPSVSTDRAVHIGETTARTSNLGVTA